MTNEIKTNLKGDADNFAFDESVRAYDRDGKLRISVSNISKSNVCDYLGSEISNYEGLGLDPKKIYKLFRDPDELAKNLESFNGIPILNTHAPAYAWDHPKGKVVGTTGTDAAYTEPYLTNSLIFWVEDSIRKIETNEQRELSPGYHYVADMTPGTFGGQAYDGVMRNIFGNHLAVIPVGRTGADVIVGDSTLEIVPMVKKALTIKAALAKGAVMASAKLATDAKLDLNPVLSTVTSKNWLDKKAEILAVIKPHLAQDADIKTVSMALDSLDKEEDMAKDEDDEDEKKKKEMAKDEEDEKEAKKKEMAKDEDDEDEGMAGDEPDDTKGAAKKEDGFSKPAMDKAIRLATDKAIGIAVDKAVKDAVAATRGIAEAEAIALPFVGKLTMSFDSAEDVYKAALGALGLSVEGLHPSAFKPILLAQPKPGKTKQHMANDSAPVTVSASLAAMFPDLDRIA